MWSGEDVNVSTGSAPVGDLLIVGGGINGCGIARDAAGRGLSVSVVEMGDLASATSSASTKLFHGGLRYLDYFKFRLVREALSEIGVTGITVIEVKGFGRQKGHTELYRGAEYVVDFLPKIKVEIAIDDDLLDRVIEAISAAAKTGKIGDGKIFVYELSQAIRIRTGESGPDAL